MEPSKAAIERANELIAEAPRDQTRSATFMALLSYIDRVDRVAREIESFILKEYPWLSGIREKAQPLMLPDPEPDPLVEAIKVCNLASLEGIEHEKADELRQALTAAGYEIRKVGHD